MIQDIDHVELMIFCNPLDKIQASRMKFYHSIIKGGSTFISETVMTDNAVALLDAPSSILFSFVVPDIMIEDARKGKILGKVDCLLHEDAGLTVADRLIRNHQLNSLKVTNVICCYFELIFSKVEQRFLSGKEAMDLIYEISLIRPDYVKSALDEISKKGNNVITGFEASLVFYLNH